ncbi:hypothetical protein [Pyxidicoccus sp. MSG2]|uniref:hypothetical protein n=1 Tax=Pyxidicoccus sp. MSG2 TaxID=2996790 RepID=UPI00227175CE|nr:hypothetical protein [Pyxidicoccus sp. MSG2]MCY1022472.1 hypothetical protein [Pyxidicoccus sp. MSG2]
MKCLKGWLLIVPLLAGVGAQAEEPTPQAAPDQGKCDGKTVTDVTEPQLKAWLERGNVRYEQLGEVETRQSLRQPKVSTARYLVTDDQGNQLQVSVECTLTCSGLSCSPSGCDAWSGGCSSYSCFGSGCTGGSCSKKSTAE